MKKVILAGTLASAAVISAVFALSAVTCAGEGAEKKAVFVFKSAEAEPAAVKAGETFKVTAKFGTGTDEEAAGYKIYTYVRDVPPGFKRVGWELRKSADSNPEWSSYSMPNSWLSTRLSGEDLAVIHNMKTENWPSGDYRLYIQIFVRNKASGEYSYPFKSFLLSITDKDN